MKRTGTIFLLLAILAAAGCTTSYWSEDADEEVAGVLAEKRAGFEVFRESGIRDPSKEAATADEKQEAPDLSWVPETVGLREALTVATKLNRNYLSEKESLYLAALDLTGEQNDYSPVFAGALSTVLSGGTGANRSRTDRADLSVSQILPTGGRITLGGDASSTNVKGGGGATYDSGLEVSLSQPILRDAGYETSHESLTRAERNVVYAIRDFELFREDFTIDVTNRFYSLVRQGREIRNAEKDLEARQFLKNQSEEKFGVGLASEVDKLRAAREFLRAQNDLLQLKESYQLALDRFKIQLGLPTSFDLEIRPEEPEFKPVRLALGRAVEAALHNRLDLITTRDRLEDSERALRIAVNRILPQLDLAGNYGRSATGAERLSDLEYDTSAWTLGLTLTLPLERTRERNALRSALIDRDQSRRSVTLAEDNVILDVRNSLRRLRRAETTLEIRRQEIEVANKEAEAAGIRFEAGEMDNRNVTDARNAVLRAENAYIGDLVEYEVARIQLMRDVGILFIDENGMWVER